MVSVCRDLGTFVKRNKNFLLRLTNVPRSRADQLRDYMATRPARFSAHRSSPAHVITANLNWWSEDSRLLNTGLI